MTNTSETILQRYHKWLAPEASIIVKWDRNEEDQYDLDISFNSKTLEITEQDIYKLIPAGSQWSQLLGWHSYFGIPFPDSAPRALVIGVEAIAHHRWRGAYLVFHAYIFPFPVSLRLIDRLQHLVEEIYPSNEKEGKLNTVDGVVRTNSTNADEHVAVEGAIIRSAIKYYQKDVPLLFRTVVLLESQLLVADHIKTEKILATVPEIEETFSDAALKLLNRSKKKKSLLWYLRSS